MSPNHNIKTASRFEAINRLFEQNRIIKQVLEDLTSTLKTQKTAIHDLTLLAVKHQASITRLTTIVEELAENQAHPLKNLVRRWARKALGLGRVDRAEKTVTKGGHK